ncbi:hypothetical protein C8J95_103389 [Elizabethkingia sp. YR214]|uniref:hypothetical protein n=1 Tax=Elizabethkingia sp. YR214 TaxID=2135667 RepID=UPI000D31DA14|nr:hypothetical protein [Elizabethkingia sp. YR214]PUB33789.1 hypothetical protein C8J95_103389 [Elizabethkingia sp. YR214]
MKYLYIIIILLLISWAPQGEISNNKEKEQLDCSCSEYDNHSVIGTNIHFGKNGVLLQCATVIRAYVTDENGKNEHEESHISCIAKKNKTYKLADSITYFNKKDWVKVPKETFLNRKQTIIDKPHSSFYQFGLNEKYQIISVNEFYINKR